METRKTYQDSHVTIDLGDTVFKDYLDAQEPKTRKTYDCPIRKLLEYTNNKSGSQLLAEHKTWDGKILVYLQWLKCIS